MTGWHPDRLPKGFSGMTQWTLSKSRGLFFAQTREPPNVCFWVTENKRAQAAGHVTMQVPPAVALWKPSAATSQSNCPELDLVVKRLMQRIDQRWKARLANLYAGRVHSSPDRAFSAVSTRGGMLVIDLEYSIAIAAYVAVYDKFLAVLDTRFEHDGETVDAISAGVHEEFEEFIEAYRGGGLPQIRGDWLLALQSEQHQVSHSTLTRIAEEYVVAHEVAHHILRHLSTRADREATELVNEYLLRPAIASELRSLNRSQRQEVEADVLALLLIAGEISTASVDLGDVLQALHGAVFALLAASHLDAGWTSHPDDEHPGGATRIAVIAKLVTLLYGLQPIPAEVSTVADATIPRTVAVLLAFSDWASDRSAFNIPDMPMLRQKFPNKSIDILTYTHFATILGMLTADEDRKSQSWSLVAQHAGDGDRASHPR